VRGFFQNSYFHCSTWNRGPDVDENNDISTTRRVKRFVKTKVAGSVQNFRSISVIYLQRLNR
jgi:hypothetical protein